MKKCCNQNISVPSRQIVRRKKHRLHYSCEIKIKEHLKNIPGTASITKGTWLCWIYKSDFSLTLHCVDKYWVIHHVLLDFIWLPTPHNGSSTLSMVMELATHWNSTGKLRAVTTKNASNVCLAMEEMLHNLNICVIQSILITTFPGCCIPHIINPAVGACFMDIRGKISSLRFLLAPSRCSVKHLDIYELTQKTWNYYKRTISGCPNTLVLDIQRDQSCSQDTSSTKLNDS